MKYQVLLFPLSVICVLLMVKYWSSLNTITSRPREAGEPAGGVSQDQGDVCSALFTVTDTPVDMMLHRYIHHLREAARYRTNGTDWSIDDWMMATYVVPSSQDLEASAAAITGVREVRLKRTSSTGVSTDNYQKLSRLLPHLISYDKISKNCDENMAKERREKMIRRKVEEDNQENKCLSVRGSSILGVTKGVLPYVPCIIAPYRHSHTFSTCVRKRIEKKQSLCIHFLGDSKIRNIFQAFLNQTDSEYQYMVMYMNQTKKWRDLRGNIRDDDIQYEDMEATSEAEPRMRINLSFRKFMSISRSELQSDAEMTLLRRWAAGDEVPPDLLLVGYSTWLLQRSLNLDNHHALGFMLALQKEVVPLLEQISRRSRVLVLPQSRLRQRGRFSVYNTRTTYNNGNFDWIEMMFLYHLRRYRDNQNSLKAREMMQLSSASSEVQKAKSLPADTGQARSGYSLDDTSQGRSGEQLEQPYRDYLAPQESGGGGGLWWWDTSLPLNLAEISECEEMYRQGRESDPLYQSDLLRCRDAHHAGSATQRDLVTMMFNLMCNSVLGLDHSVCCS